MRLRILLALAVLAACGVKDPKPDGGHDGGTKTQKPVLEAFSASVDGICGPTSVKLSWAQTGATSLTLEPGGDVTGLTEKSVDISAATAFTLTAKSSAGSTTRTVSVDFKGFPHLIDAGVSLNAAGAVFTQDRLHVGFYNPNDTLTYLCDLGGCAAGIPQPPYTVGYGSPLLAGLDNSFLMFWTWATMSAPVSLHVFAEDGGVFGEPEVRSEVEPKSVLVNVYVRPGSGDLAALTSAYGSATLSLLERGGGHWSGSAVYVGGMPLSGGVPLGAGYASDGTAWILYIHAPDVLTLYRRAGAAWTRTGSAIMNAGNAIGFYFGARVTVSPLQDQLLVTSGASAGGAQDKVLALTVNLRDNIVSAPTEVLPATTISTSNVDTAAAFAPDGGAASYVFHLYDGRAWTGRYDVQTNSFSASIPFHPEAVVRGVAITYDACGKPLVVYDARRPGETVSTTYFEEL